MYDQIPADIPQYVRTTIYSQIRRLLKYSCFNRQEDREDLIQELLLFYLELLREHPKLNEAYVVTSIKNCAANLLRTKVRKHFGLFSSLDDISAGELPISTMDIENMDVQIVLNTITKRWTDKERHLVHLYINENYSFNEICQLEHVSKATIFKVIEKLKKHLKK